jgi:lysophospholipase L1-like esterase
MKEYSYLALGDSYTIGEQVLPEENFPNQTAALLLKTASGADSRRRGNTEPPSAVANPDGGYKITTPEIIAVTGWTTDELDAGINAANIAVQYDIVSLLIGVNNQYRGRSASDFKVEFEHLLQRAIQFAGNIPQHVFVLSIPDWGVTPFAEGRNRKQIAAEIDAYNTVCEKSAAGFGTHYIDITTGQRPDGDKDEFLAADKLHPSGKEYAKWAVKLAATIKNEFDL